MSTARIITGDVREVLPTLEAGSVQCVVTSPPYFGLRSYLPKDHPDKAKEIGTERTHVEYVEKIVGIFREVRRVLRDDGTCWINLGDSYAGSWGAQSREHAGKHAPNVSALSANQAKAAQRMTGTGSKQRTPGVAAKNLLGIPWRIAFALQEDGWFLRSEVIEEVELYCPCGCGHVMEERIWRHSQDREIIWSKPNPMPSSVTDRPTTSHEHLFLLSKSPRYSYDGKAIAEPAVSAPAKARDMRVGTTAMRGQAAIRKRGKNEETPDRTRAGFNGRYDTAEDAGLIGNTRNKRTVWKISPASFDDAHFAVMPNELARNCILAGAGGGHVLDPFAGAGTVGVEALKLGCNFTGIELYESEFRDGPRSHSRRRAPAQSNGGG